MKLNASEWLPQEPDFELFHIYCHQKDYRLCYALNEHFKCAFKRVRDFLEDPEKPHLPTYAQFMYEDEVTHKEYFLISNQPLIKDLVAKAGDLFATEQPELLIPELTKVDYFFQAYGQFDEFELAEIEDQLNLIPLINAAQRVDTGALKSYLNLMH
ncbi:MAG: IPExxxVDY family protein [Flavobacteriales bacterium]|nr:IPExxxVDY family protein [Flavobacteriales bacterium]